ncbi:Uncharacterised protein [Segatella copri]|nr:Uncharacterised protein [Segatella copri]
MKSSCYLQFFQSLLGSCFFKYRIDCIFICSLQ